MLKHLDDMVNVSHGIGIPFGGIGTGYSVFGKYGFSEINFDSTPNEGTKNYPNIPETAWSYTCDRESDGPFQFVLAENDQKTVLSQRKLSWLNDAVPVDKIESYAYLPKGYFNVYREGLGLDISIEAFSPMTPHDLDNSSIPVQIFNIAVTNNSSEKREINLGLLQNDKMKCDGNVSVYNDKHGQVAFLCLDGEATAAGVNKDIVLEAGQTECVTFIIGWHYPCFKTFSPDLRDHYKRYYTIAFKNVKEVIKFSADKIDLWSKNIDQWHDSLGVPAYFNRLWFSSLSSVICSTMMSDDPYFFEIETPHHHICTMDVNVYSSWLYLINWPQIEQMEIKQFVDSIHEEGEKAGFVWHSLWDDPLEYSEESTFITRVYRDVLWLNDKQLLADGFKKSLLAANYVYNKDNYKGLLNSSHGNQSFDAWLMPGVSSYVNCAWLYALHGLEKMARLLGKKAQVGGIDAVDLLREARQNYDSLLWDSQLNRWKLFYRTPGANEISEPDSVFTDQLFGKWVLLVDKTSDEVLDSEKVRSTLEYIYGHNMIEDSQTGFKGWVNGLMPGRKIDPSGHICKAFWICPQLDLGSLLGDAGDESASLDVFESVERSVFNNHLAVGEYNQVIDDDLNTMISPEEPAKDTPRFPPYPRYKCCWEYLVRLIGLKMDSDYLYIKPFKSLDFQMQDVVLAGEKLSITVKKKWSKAILDGVIVDGPVVIERKQGQHTIEFI